MYDYKEAVKNDVIDYIKENYTDEEIKENLSYSGSRNKWEQSLYDDLFVSDSVTGNASGSYTFNSYKAEEYLCHNMDLLAEALEEFGDDLSYLKKGAENCDVTIRCYLLNSAISEALDELENEIEEDSEDE